MRMWLRRDIIPVIENTCFFTQPLQSGKKRSAAWNSSSHRLYVRFMEWVNSGGCMPVALLSPPYHEGRYIWMEMRQYQKQKGERKSTMMQCDSQPITTQEEECAATMTEEAFMALLDKLDDEIEEM